MCFYNVDADWCAQESATTEAEQGDSTRCAECNKPIAVNEWRRHLWQQEYEECRLYDETDYDDAGNEIPHDCANPQTPCEYGMNYECDWCRNCATLLDAIQEVEKAEKCPPDSQLPMIGELYESVEQGEGWGHYLDKFRSLALTPAVAIAEAIVGKSNPEPEKSDE